jgi:hypothetical protein
MDATHKRQDNRDGLWVGYVWYSSPEARGIGAVKADATAARRGGHASASSRVIQVETPLRQTVIVSPL